MGKMYGSVGFCENCNRNRVRIHGYVRGLVHCMRCYTKHRLEDPKKRKKQLVATRQYRKRNKAKINKHNQEYIKDRYKKDPKFRLKIIESVKKSRDAKREAGNTGGTRSKG